VPWFRRKRRDDGATTEGSPVAPVPAPAPVAGPPPRRPAPRNWSRLTPLRPTVAPAPRIGEADQFVATLPGTQPLVHAPVLFGRSADAPRGLVAGLAEPLPVEPAAPAVDEPPAMPPAASSPAPQPEPEPLPPRRLPARSAPIAPTSQPLTRVTDEQVPLLHPTPVAPPPPRHESTIVTTSQTVGEEPGAAVAEPFDPTAPPRRFNLGQSRRLGLGLPLSHPGDEPEAGEPVETDPAQPPPLVHPPSAEPAPAPTATPERAEPEPTALPEPTIVPPPAASPRPETARRVTVDEPVAPVDRPQPPLTHRPEPPSRPAEAAEPDEPRSPEAESYVLPLYRPAPAAPPRPLPVDAPALQVEPQVVSRPATVPTDVASTLQATHGVDVGDVLVHRGPGVAVQAQALGAIAFARDEQVFLPEEAGPIDRAEVRGLLAHELTHVVQQRVLGTPARHGPGEAAALEAEAQDAERYFRGDTGAPPPRQVGQSLTHPPRAATPPPADAYAEQIAEQLVNRGIARRHDDGSLVFGPAAELIEAQVSDAVQRATALAAPPSAPPAPASEPVILEQWSLEDLEDQAIARQVERDDVDFERDLYLAELVAEENDTRVASGEPPLHPEVDAYRFAELRDEADREFSGRYATLDEDERTPVDGVSQAQERSSLAELGGLLGAIDSWSDEEDERRQAATEAAARRAQEGGDLGGSAFDESAEGVRNEAESGRMEMNADDMDLPDVVRRSWELTRIELRHELLIDRERRGWLTDFR
jgi:Domain of unknown function (DUF4157)